MTSWFTRACYALTIQAGEVTAYSCMPRLLPSRIARNDMDYDLLFEANTAEAWRDCLKLRCSECPTIKSMPIAQSPLFPVALMCQRFVQIFELSAFSSSDINTLVPKTDVISFYKEMNSLARRLNIKVDSTIALNQAPQLRLLEILWHYSCVAWLARMDMIAEISGRAGSPRAKALRAFETWIKTYQARLAMLHSAHILLAAAELRNVAFLVPRYVNFSCSSSGKPTLTGLLRTQGYLPLGFTAWLLPLACPTSCSQSRPCAMRTDTGLERLSRSCLHRGRLAHSKYPYPCINNRNDQRPYMLSSLWRLPGHPRFL